MLVVATELSDLLVDLKTQLKLVVVSSLGFVSFNSPVDLSKIAQSSAPGHSQVKSKSVHLVAMLVYSIAAPSAQRLNFVSLTASVRVIFFVDTEAAASQTGSTPK